MLRRHRLHPSLRTTHIPSHSRRTSVVKGDRLTLLDDSNSYWWLIRVLKTLAVGYIPAENIETPFERLARLNKHRNVDLSSATPVDVQAGAASSLAQTRFSQRIPSAGDPTSLESEEAAKSPSGWARLRLAARASADSLRGGPGNANKDDSRSQLGKGLSPVQRAQLDSPQAANTSFSKEAVSEPARNITQQGPLANGGPKNASTLSIDRLASTSSLPLIPHSQAETKKLTLTPDIARDTADYSIDAYQPSPSRGSHLTRQRSTSASSSESPLRQLASKRMNGEPLSASLEAHSTDSHTAEDGTKGSSKQTSSTKKEEKKKSGGLLSGFFGRKKDKKANKSDPLDDTRSSSLEHDRNRSSSPLSPSEHSVRSLTSPQQHTDGGSSPGGHARRMGSSENEDLFSTDAALRKQHEEAQEVIHRQQSLSREINELNGAGHHPQKKPSYPPLNSNVPSPSLGLHSPFSPGSSTASTRLAYSPAAAAAAAAAAGGGGGAGRVRPGSLIGSPGIAGMDVPMLNVLRIFAGDNVDCEATFKTVLLSAQTTTQELVVQALQRFHVSATEDDRASYYLTIKDVVSGEETVLDDHQTPLGLFELMNEALGHSALHLPSVKRSSVGSISSISSNLSLNPAISRLGMNDFSDDSAVKFHLNRYPQPSDRSHASLPASHFNNGMVPPGRKQERTGSLAPIQEDGVASAHRDRPPPPAATLASPSSPAQYEAGNPPSALSSAGSTDSSSDPLNLSPCASSPSTATITSSSPSLRFAMRVRIYSADLPEGLVFDPQSNAIIPRVVLLERTYRSSSSPSSSATTTTTTTSTTSFREKVIIFPRNIHTSEAIEHSLEAFGIAEGVVDGGDDVDDKISKRRSSSKIRYGLSMKAPDSPTEVLELNSPRSTEVPVNLISKVLDAYSVPPIFRPADRTSKEARRRSQEYHPFVLGTLQDLQPSDPIFSLRRALLHHPPPRRDHPRNSAGGLAGAVADELGLLQAAKKAPSRPAPSAQSSFKTAQESIHSVESGLLNGTPPVVSPAPLTVLSTQPNADEGIDINLHNHATIRSRRGDDLDGGPGAGQRHSYRYSYIDPSGEEFDISSLIESELSSDPGEPSHHHPHQQHGKSEVQERRSHGPRTASPSTEDGYASAPESPLSSVNRLSPSVMRQLQQHQTDDDSAIEALRVADLTIDQMPPSRQTSRDFNHASDDLLAWTVRRQGPPAEPSRAGGAAPFFAEALDSRIQRVLSKVNASTHPPWKPSAEQKPSAGMEETLLGRGEDGGAPSAGSSARSNSSSLEDADGSASPTTPLTATSPTGESSSYTPISSATRGGGIDSRLSMHREALGPPAAAGPVVGRAAGPKGMGPAWVPLLFPASAPRALLPPSSSPRPELQHDGGAGLDVLFNLVLLSASLAAAPEPEPSTTTASRPNPRACKPPAPPLWLAHPALAAFFDEPASAVAAEGVARGRLPVAAGRAGLLSSKDSSLHDSSQLDSSQHDSSLHDSSQQDSSQLDSSQQDSSQQDSSQQDSSQQDSSQQDSSSSSAAAGMSASTGDSGALLADDIAAFLGHSAAALDALDGALDRLLRDALLL
ncbi:hypothetical protein PtB15_15B85 [Puccinia triticina]|nr:hypothetical protein PtB15_15B85 [Puccinia triticina]